MFNIIALGSITLKIKRTSSSNRSCNHPLCGLTRNLKMIPKEMRYQIAIDENVFIPINARACSRHISIEAWRNVNTLIVSEEANFTKDYLEDMFKLLSKPPIKTVASKESSMH